MGRVTPAAADSARYLRYFFLEAAALSMISSLRAFPVHGACVRAGGKGVLLCGDSGEGKSTLAYAGARAGWTYVSDDATYIRDGPRRSTGNGKLHADPISSLRRGAVSGTRREADHTARGGQAVDRGADLGMAGDHNRKCHARGSRGISESPLRGCAGVGARCAPPRSCRGSSSTSFLRRTCAPRRKTTLARLLSAGVFELRYRDLGWAIDRINELAKKGN